MATLALTACLGLSAVTTPARADELPSDAPTTEEPADAGQTPEGNEGQPAPDSEGAPSAPDADESASGNGAPADETVSEDEELSEPEADSTSEDETVIPLQQEPGPKASPLTLTAQAHVQNKGWMKAATAGENQSVTVGTQGQSLRLESLRLSIPGSGSAISLRSHVQNKGWTGWTNGSTGTVGGALRLETLQAKIAGPAADTHDLYYRVHVQNIGWLGWTSNGEKAGTSGQSLRIEAIELRLVSKDGGPKPSPVGGAFRDGTHISLSSHVQNLGWQRAVGQNGVSGTTGRGLRVEALRASVVGFDGSATVSYRAHVQNVGWTGWAKNGGTAGTTGRSLRVEAVTLTLGGDLSTKYDLYYRVHVQGIGWLGWAKAGQDAGSEGLSLRLEAIQMRLVSKGGNAPGALGSAFVKVPTVSGAVHSSGQWRSGGNSIGVTGKGWCATNLRLSLSGGSPAGTGVTYRAARGASWSGWAQNGANAYGNQSQDLNAVQVKLTGAGASTFDVWYRVHVSKIGWLGWTRNGGSAGCASSMYPVECVQVRIQAKGSSAPGSTNLPYLQGFMTGDAQLDNIVQTIIATKTGRGSGALRNAYNYVATSFRYIDGNHWPTGNWSPAYAKEMWRNRGGNCYRFAALFRELARGLGYKARTVCGTVLGTYGRQLDHSWVELEEGGRIYIYDPESLYEHPGHNFFKRTYGSAPLTYTVRYTGPW